MFYLAFRLMRCPSRVEIGISKDGDDLFDLEPCYDWLGGSRVLFVCDSLVG